jgi:CO dehydrogenase/acetyl-CoA synthase epsilon subunit
MTTTQALSKLCRRQVERSIIVYRIRLFMKDGDVLYLQGEESYDFCMN